MLQLSFDPPDVPMARQTDPFTSHAAASAARELQQAHQEIILSALRKHGPMGKDHIAARTRLDGVAVCRRTVELQRQGLIRWTGKTVRSLAGRMEREWEAA